MKVLRTETNVYGEMFDAVKALGYKGHHNQVRIVCKCKSLAEANRKCEAAGIGRKVFHPDYTSEIYSDGICENADIVFIVNQAGDQHVTIEQVHEWMEQNKNE